MELTREELGLVDELLHEALKELRVEIHRTDAMSARASLGQREALLSSILNKIDATGLHGNQPIEPAAARPNV
ncbi:MAG: hypothetical protein ACYCW6_14070 [Candidatus Xenobia bacterium]